MIWGTVWKVEAAFVSIHFSETTQFPSVASTESFFERPPCSVETDYNILLSFHDTFLECSIPSFSGTFKAQFNSHFILKPFLTALVLRTCSCIRISSTLPREAIMNGVRPKFDSLSKAVGITVILRPDEKMVRLGLFTSHSSSEAWTPCLQKADFG